MSKRNRAKEHVAGHLSPAELLYGSNAVSEVLRHEPSRLHSVYVAQGSELEKTVVNLARGSQIKIEPVGRDELDLLAGCDRHQGVVAKLRSRPHLEARDVITELVALSPVPSVVVLDRVQDPQNFGAIIRVCEAAGVGAVFFSDRQSAPISPAVRKASMGASELVPVVRVKNVAEILDYLKEKGMWVVGTALGEDSQDLYQAQLPTPSVFVFGSEGKGLRPLVASKCDLLVMIPMSGRMQSLNVSQAVSVTLFEARRRDVLTAD